jgi:hypothetical protein
MDAKQLQKRAKRRHAELTRVWADPRYKQVIGRYVSAGLLTTTTGIQPNSQAIALKDALWAGLAEPRILELLPALIVKRPALFSDVTDLPDDLRAAVSALRRHERPKDFRGIPGATLLRWLPAVGQRGKVPSRLKSFRLQQQDLELLDRLSQELGLSQTDVLRRGLRHLAASQLRAAAAAEQASPSDARRRRGRKRASAPPGR